MLGIPHAARASSTLFLVKTLGTPSVYPSLSQKVLKGAAARLMVFYMALLCSRTVSDAEPMTKHRANVFLALSNLYTTMATEGRHWSGTAGPEAIRDAYMAFRHAYTSDLACSL